MNYRINQGIAYYGVVNDIIEEHQKWLLGDPFAKQADFMGANLEGFDFGLHNLARANFSGANLTGVNFRGANLFGADFYYTNLSRACFADANLSQAVFIKAVLSGTNFSGANLKGALFDEKEEERLGVILTEPMVGYKKCRDNTIVELEIPAGAIVFSINNLKCRTNKVIVKKIYGVDSIAAALSGRRTRVIPKTRAFSSACGLSYLSYYVGDVINIKNFNTQYNVECAEGIHFFKDLNCALNYVV